jgi:hypothetical protein
MIFDDESSTFARSRKLIFHCLLSKAMQQVLIIIKNGIGDFASVGTKTQVSDAHLMGTH